MTEIKTTSGCTMLADYSELEKLRREIINIHTELNRFDTHNDVVQCLKWTKACNQKAFGVKATNRRALLENKMIKFLSKSATGAYMYLRTLDLSKTRDFRKEIEEFRNDPDYVEIRHFLQKRRV